MSSKCSIILSNENEHIYTDCSDPISKNGKYKGDGIILEFNKKNADLVEDEEDFSVFLLEYSDLWEKLNAIFQCKSALIMALRHIKLFTPTEKRNPELEVLIEKILKTVD